MLTLYWYKNFIIESCWSLVVLNARNYEIFSANNTRPNIARITGFWNTDQDLTFDVIYVYLFKNFQILWFNKWLNQSQKLLQLVIAQTLGIFQRYGNSFYFMWDIFVFKSSHKFYLSTYLPTNLPACFPMYACTI